MRPLTFALGVFAAYYAIVILSQVIIGGIF